MKISLPKMSVANQIARLSAKITCAGEQKELWYSLPAEHASWFLADRCDGFVIGLLLQAMTRKEDIELEGPISSRLHHNLQNFLIPMMAQAFPNFYKINIIPKSLTNERGAGQGVCTGFSGGVDSFATFKQHYVDESSPGYKITHLLFHNAGSHGHSGMDGARKLFKQRHQMILPFAEEVGVPFVMVDSNLSEIFEIDFITMHSALNASIPLILQNQFQRYYYASTYKYADCSVLGIDDIARFDPLAFHLFSTEGLDCVSTGCQMSRVEKTSMVATYEPSYRYLNVCVDPDYEGRNCSVCFKCRRTILTLQLMGKADLYRDIFNFQKFDEIRSAYIRHLFVYKSGSFESEIAELYRNGDHGLLTVAFKLRHSLDVIF